MKLQRPIFQIVNLSGFKKLVAVICIAISSFSFGQSKKLWMLTAENAYKAKDWATAAVYYAKVLDDTTVLETFVLPYEAQMVNLKLKSLVKVPELQLRRPKKDSTLVKKDSTQIANADTSKRKKKPTPNFNPITSTDYVYWKLANSYRMNADYDHAAKTYKICVERKAYPDARYYYGLSLMALKRYNEALVELDEYVTHTPENDSLMHVAEKKESSCYFALDTMTNVKREVRAKMLDTLVFNKGTANFAPQYYLNPNKIIFTSARRNGVVKILMRSLLYRNGG
jgi:tetratricopeptide (TPR) repeat protein